MELLLWFLLSSSTQSRASVWLAALGNELIREAREGNAATAVKNLREFLEKRRSLDVPAEIRVRDNVDLTRILMTEGGSLDPLIQIRFLARFLEDGVFTPAFERELVFLLWLQNHIEAITAILEHIGAPVIHVDPESAPPLIGRCAKQCLSYFYQLKLLRQRDPLFKDEIEALVMDWAYRRFREPDSLVKTIDARTPESVVRGVLKIIELVPEWPESLSSGARAKLNFWLAARACEEHLLGPTSESHSSGR